MSDVVRVGIVGLGKMGKIRAREFERDPRSRVVVGSDPDTATYSAFPGVTCCDDYQRVIESDVDAICVATPNNITPDVVVMALEHGKHVLCEKPPGRSVADIERIIDVADKHAELTLKFGFNHRYHAGIQEAKRIVDSGTLGDILWISGRYGKSGGTGFESSWRSDKEVSGAGILLDQGIHMVDLFRFFCGDFVEVKSMVTTAYWDIDMEDNAFALMRDTRGRIASLHSSSTMWKHRFNLEINMADGYVAVNGILSSTRSYGDETISVARKQLDDGFAMGKPREEVIYFDTDPSWELEVSDFLGHIVDGTPVDSGNADDALKAMKLVFTIYDGDKQEPKP